MCAISVTIVNRIQRHTPENRIFFVVEALNFLSAGVFRPALGQKQNFLNRPRAFDPAGKTAGSQIWPLTTEISYSAPIHIYDTLLDYTLKTKRNLLYIRNQYVPRSKHFPQWL